MTVIEVVDAAGPAARDRGQGAAARLYLEGPRAPLRGSAGGAIQPPGRAAFGQDGHRPARSRRLTTSKFTRDDRIGGRSARLGMRKGLRHHGSETIIGIDLGTTNSEVAVIRDGRADRPADEDGDPILPSVVGLDPQGRLLVGKAARNQYVLAPERTVRSIKRKMGQETTVTLGDQKYTPQEISAIILRTLKQRAEKVLGIRSPRR